MKPEDLAFIINHVFLPPDLPQQADAEEALPRMNAELLKLILQSTNKFKDHSGSTEQWKTVVKMLASLYNLQGKATLSKAELSVAIGEMRPGDVITLHIAAQNAGIILQHLETEMLFVSFEASPPSAKVMGITGKLLCSYPGPAIAVPISKVRDPTFREELALFLEQMDCTVLADAMPTSTKANTSVVEPRDTAHPKFITEMLTGILRAIGRPADVNRFQKRIADDVLWNQAYLPWRRSPLWLVVRVALQITLKDLNRYKSFMVFFLADVLELAVKEGLESDLLFIMNTKLSRRAYKLRDQIPQFVLNKACEVTTTNQDVLQGRWRDIRGFHSKDLNWRPQDLSFEKDTQLSLQNSGKYLAEVIARKATDPQPLPFDPKHPSRNPIPSGSLPSRNLMSTPEKECHIMLADFEAWVQENLNDWTTNNLYREVACKELSGWVDDYTTIAKKAYQSNPENMSIMLLTTYELWVAIDRVALYHYPLLSEYAPELVGSDKLFEPLLLPRYQQMERLHRVESYLQERRNKASSSNPSIFSDSPNSNSFSVRYYRQSRSLQELGSRIQSDAATQKQRKIEEFNRKKREYDDLVALANNQTCSQYWDYRGRYRHYSCSKCDNQQRASNMRIDVYEWPLPGSDFERMAVIFELRCPLGVSFWRDTTYKILVDVCTSTEPDDKSEKPFEQLYDYSGLNGYFVSQGQRLAWSSKTKSFLRSHYRDCRFPSSVDTICVANALNYSLFDGGSAEWTRKRLSKFDVKKLCTFSLPDPEGPYKGLQYAIDDTSHTPNSVISKQSNCSIGLSLHEYDAFGTLRAGHRIQWLNIAREIRANILTFSDEAVSALIMQAAWEVGPFDASNIFRESHIDLARLEFGKTLLGELERMLTSIKANWLESISAKILITLTARLLSVSKQSSITEGAISLLRKARKVTLDWTRQLVVKLQECEVDEAMKDLQLRVLQMAAICRATYDVDNHGGHLDAILKSAEDIAILIECATIVHDNTPVHTASLPKTVQNLLDRDRRLSHTLERYLRNSICQTTLSEGLDRSVEKVYPAYNRGSSWDRLSAPNDRWIITRTGGGRPQILRYNILNGQLLVDGSPVGRMPEEFVSHPTYQRLFNDKVLDVFPSNEPGMRYQARHEISDPKPEDQKIKHQRIKHQVHFTMHGDELIIRTRPSGDTQVYELVPYKKLSGDFPNQFVEGYVHWLNIMTRDIEFRPISHRWTMADSNWHMSYPQYGSSSMHLEDNRMLDIRSPTASMISSVLSPIEEPNFIDIRFGKKDGKELISARLPRLKLEFFLNSDKKLECRQFRGAVVDTNQDIGTMNGLINRLVLRQGNIRSVIIPYGSINYPSHKSHVRVHINTTGEEKVQYYLYNIDSRLGRLIGNGTLASHLYKIYLHAVTSHCLPDPLTSRTGTEEALDNLRSAATWSFQKLQSDEIEILRLIASLTPSRQYYPKHLEAMQTVKWKPIPPTMQHDEFHTIVVKIFTHAERFHVFREDDKKVPAYYESKSNNKLLERAAIRNAIYRKDEFGGSLLGTAKDTSYIGRDSLIDQSKEAQVCSVAKAVESWCPNIDISGQLMSVLENWGYIKGVTSERTRLGYNHQWINPDLAAVWGSVYDACRQTEKNNSTYQLIFFLCTLAYSERVALPIIGALLAFATNTQLRSHQPPQYPSYNLGNKYAPDESRLKNVIDGCSISFNQSQEANLTARGGESESELWRRQNSEYRDALRTQSEGFVSNLISQWPCASPNTPTNVNYRLLNTSKAMSEIKPMFQSWYENKKFREHISELQSVLNSIRPVKPTTPEYSFQSCKAGTCQVVTTIRFEDLLLRDAPVISDFPVTTLSASTISRPVPTLPTKESGLQLLLDDFKKQHYRKFEEQYAQSMYKSLEALEEQTFSAKTFLEQPPKPTLETLLTQCSSHMDITFQKIRDILAPLREVENLMNMAGLWPCVSPLSILQKLPTSSPTKLSAQWKRSFISYGKAVSKLQRSERLILAYGKENEFDSEAGNTGHQDWDPMVYPDWLLIEIENNFLVRPVQNEIASEMITPTSEGNQTIQLNMGEGKSSVIVPIIAAALADGEKLVRVVVLKPLSTQMFRLLVQRLSGLTRRRIFYMPFSRAVRLNTTKAAEILNLYEECMRVRGILLVQPEHILSFKLIGLERLYEKDKELAKILLNSQHWLDKNSRDILDESDAILHTQNELIYTIGGQKSLENSPDRWMIVQEIFNLVSQHITTVVENFPQGLEVETDTEKKPGSFPVTRILKLEAGVQLLDNIVEDIIKGLLPTVSFRLFPEGMRKLARDFITKPEIELEQAQPLLDFCGEDNTSRDSLLLLRGLIAENILLFALKDKRWRVDYGLTPQRIPKTLLAVPFRAKDVPAPRAEFSHPDVAIVLTCLSYYYTGLDDDQLGDCFKILLQLSNPIVEYEGWIDGLGDAVPETLLKLSGINLLDNEERTNTIFPLFRFNKSVIDFYLSHVVFPKYAKEFVYKLTSSGWDIAAAKSHPTTGFSGTNDNRDLLPLSVTQHESQKQLNTNAKVLSYLLQPENKYVCAEDSHGGRLKVGELLERLVGETPPITVLLDVGAQVLELRNLEVAELWLSLDTKAQAVVFFNEEDELTVLSRDTSKEPFEVSSFSKQMDQCLVYLDEVHTRGTDLKLPLNSRAAVTLGPNLTKDRLVQACMRMRKLGHGQSVLFCAPPEIHQKIRNATPRPSDSVSDVLHWCMVETCINNRNNIPIWAKQGYSYQARDLAYSGVQVSSIFPPLLCEQEAQTLQERFGPRQSGNDFLFGPTPLEMKERDDKIQKIQDRCTNFEVGSLRGAHAQEEQERELSYEVEREQQVERPPPMDPLAHRIHSDVLRFIETGTIPSGSTGLTLAFQGLKTSAKGHHENAWSSKFYVTVDFAKTIDTSNDDKMDQFLRPVRWVVSAGGGDRLVIMSPYEVNELIPKIRRSSLVSLYIYSPKVTKGMPSFLEDPESWTIPPIPNPISESLANELNIFAGQLYLKDYNTYKELCGFLGLYLGEIPQEQNLVVQNDGFVGPNSRLGLGMKIHSPFLSSPVLFLRGLMGFRRKDQDYLATHLGQILHGRLLVEKDFEMA